LRFFWIVRLKKPLRADRHTLREASGGRGEERVRHAGVYLATLAGDAAIVVARGFVPAHDAQLILV